MPLSAAPVPAEMYDVVLAAQAPLVFRSGRPFGAGSRDGANFPWPSSFAGLLRSATLAARGWPPILSDAQAAQLAGLAAQGPFLARREGGVPLTPLFARPADAVRFFDAAGGRAVYRRLRPPSCRTTVI
ncbi:MAG TPA: type III-B CRISPR module-associated Cmr3 family protein, partial [Accumulibacter sp.]|nr:type III-B CRISPR module-associated Cmr3 family protein [Accumulibacter sp.]